jgi:hypothetical protein
LRYRNPYGQVVVSLLMCIIGWLVLRVHLFIIEPFYLRFGPKYRGGSDTDATHSGKGTIA